MRSRTFYSRGDGSLVNVPDMRALILLLLILAACGRPLTPAEKTFARQLHGPTIDTSRIRAIHGSPVGGVTYQRPKRPRLACRELILPEPPTEMVTVGPVAMVIHNKVFYARDWYLDDYLQDYPDKLNLLTAMLFAHEITHVWQWQNRDITGYSPFAAVMENIRARDPYSYELEAGKPFLDYGFEQQARIVGDFVCHSAANPKSAKTKALGTLLKPVFGPGATLAGRN